MNKEELLRKLNKHDDLRHPIEFRALGSDELGEDEKDEMVIEGKAIAYNQKIKLFSFDGVDYYEVIEKGALDNADLTDVFLRYNHKDDFMVLARTRNQTLEIDERDDGVYIRAILANTSGGRDLYELVKRGDVNKMSFAFTENEEFFDEDQRTWTVKDIEKLYDVSAVDIPAYSDTSLYARRYNEVETRCAELENLKLQRKRVEIKNKNNF